MNILKKLKAKRNALAKQRLIDQLNGYSARKQLRLIDELNRKIERLEHNHNSNRGVW